MTQMSEVSDSLLKITMKDALNNLMENIESMQDQIGDFSRDWNSMK